MKRIRIVGLCLVAAFAMSAVMAASAAAAAPEYGKCVKQAGGKFKDAGCLTASKPGEEKYEWYAAFGSSKPLVHTGFKAHIKEVKAGAATLEGIAGVKVQCSEQNSTGKFTSNTTVSDENVVFKGCKVEGTGKCENTAKEGEITVSNLEGVLGVEKFGETAAKNKLGNDLTPIGGAPFTEFECAGSPTKVRGHVISPITTNKMANKTTVKFTATKGKQKPEQFETSKGVKGPKQILETAFLGSAKYEQSGQTLATIQENEGAEKVEANTVN
jgi:hypothetical protein